jgi:hypothetical protein
VGHLYEFRDYHYDGDFDAYKEWWVEGIEVLGARMEILGVWFDSGIPARIGGVDPMPLPHGSANVSWIIRWDDLAQRDTTWDALQVDAEWIACAERHPGFDRYRHMSVRFLEKA